MTQQKVVIVDAITEDRKIEEKILSGVARLVSLDARHERELIGHVEDAGALILFHTIALTEATLDRLESCRVIVRAGVGYDNVDHRAARLRDIPVCNVPDYGTEEVADSAIGHTLALTRGLYETSSRLRAETCDWSHLSSPVLTRLRDRPFGIVGLGRIGTATALRAKALGLEVLYYDPYKPRGADKALGVRRVDTLEDLLEQSAIVSLHCPLSDETHGMIGARALSRMQKGAFLVNTARGSLVETDLLVEAVESGQLAGVALDVLAAEPPSADDPLVRAWRDPSHPAHHKVVLTPHIAFYCEEGLEEMRSKAAETCRLALLGHPLPNVVN